MGQYMSLLIYIKLKIGWTLDEPIASWYTCHLELVALNGDWQLGGSTCISGLESPASH